MVVERRRRMLLHLLLLLSLLPLLLGWLLLLLLVHVLLLMAVIEIVIKVKLTPKARCVQQLCPPVHGSNLQLPSSCRGHKIRQHLSHPTCQPPIDLLASLGLGIPQHASLGSRERLLAMLICLMWCVMRCVI